MKNVLLVLCYPDVSVASPAYVERVQAAAEKENAKVRFARYRGKAKSFGTMLILLDLNYATTRRHVVMWRNKKMVYHEIHLP